MHQIMQKQRMQIKNDTSINKQINMNHIIKRKLLPMGCGRKDFEDRGLNGYLMAKAKDWSTCTAPISQQTPNPSLGAWIPDHPVFALWITSGKPCRITEYQWYWSLWIPSAIAIQPKTLLHLQNQCENKLKAGGSRRTIQNLETGIEDRGLTENW